MCLARVLLLHSHNWLKAVLAQTTHCFCVCRVKLVSPFVHAVSSQDVTPRRGWQQFDVSSGWVRVLRGPRPPSERASCSPSKFREPWAFRAIQAHPSTGCHCQICPPRVQAEPHARGCLSPRQLEKSRSWKQRLQPFGKTCLEEGVVERPELRFAQCNRLRERRAR